MFRHLDHRAGHYLLLLVVAGVLFLPNLGAASLWDIDEGNNAEAGREMREAGDWVVPTFNYDLRVDKPALLYWLQIGGYEAFGVSEFAARLPSALAAALTLLLTYELSRRMFGRGAGLLSGLVLGSASAFCAAAHFANPDALLTLCTVLALLFFWLGFSGGKRLWFVPMGVAMGLAVLAKGLVGLVLPFTTAGLFLLWSGELRRLLDWRLLPGVMAFGLVAVPWYAWVGAETRGLFLRGFFLGHHLDRFLKPLEGHQGPFWYYLPVLVLGLLPWSVFLGPSVWYSIRQWQCRRSEPQAAETPGLAHSLTLSLPDAFLWSWIATYLVFFSLSGTKLPNYILPLYPPLAILTGNFLDRWRRGVVAPPAWVLNVSLGCLALVGLGVTAGLLVVGGLIPVAAVRGRTLPGLTAWSALGLLPLAAAALAWWWLRRQQRTAALIVLTTTATLLVAVLAALGPAAVDTVKAPRALAAAVQAAQTEPEVRLGCYQYFQPSMVFYCQRKVERLESRRDLVEFLSCPLPVYLFVPADIWESELAAAWQGSCRLLARHRDVYCNCDVVVITNR
jgi:4-amino-4-deoxy-L-arabinose transferase-like glycosyltransferase